MMEFEQAKAAEAIRASVRAGMTTAEAVRARYVERSLDTVESTYRAPTIVSDDAPDEATMPAKLMERAKTGWSTAARAKL